MSRHLLLSLILATLAATTLGSCVTSPYGYRSPRYPYGRYVYDDPYYPYAMIGGYYWYAAPYPYFYLYGGSEKTDIPPAVRLLLSRWNAAVEGPCATTTSSGDADQDGIDSNATVALTCTSTTAERTAEVRGTVNVRDVDDGAADAGYALSFDPLTIRVVSANGATTSRRISGTMGIQKSNGDAAGYTLDRDMVVELTERDADGAERRTRSEMRGEGTFRPEISDGGVVMKGALTLSGEGIFTDDDGTTTRLTRRTDPALHWNRECAQEQPNDGFDGGAITFQTSEGEETRVVYESCNARVVAND